MFKQVLILAGSVIAIAVAVASAAGDPAEKPAEPAAQAEKKAPSPPKPAATDDSYYDDEEDFVFGEPVSYDEDGKPDAAETPSEYTSSGDTPERQVPSYRPVERPRGTPKKGEPGSRENPIEILPNIPPPTGKTVEAPLD